MTPLDGLVAAVDESLRAGGTEREMCERMRPAMAALLDPQVSEPIPAWAEEPWEGQAVGNLLHADPEGRFHVLAVVFPEGTSSGVHHHGCWGVIGYLRGGDEETRYGDDLTETSRLVWHRGDITYLLPDEEGAGSEPEPRGCWHRVRNPGPGTGVSVHVLCRTPAEHPHKFYDRAAGSVVDFPFVEVAPGRWRAELS